ncbi:glycosyl-4,4'-diaponeurosporenoate acyltransferase CrtO family protein [Olleya marilimosa]|uniref:glycosyl-4,4'-diaponeurosporenoate acyltransferase CrtO family protein n=1 Tax=Olleya marilimosa TaxID=272164 RepID=UPI000480A891|nr:hypothetical protein [Olleya marilimosa]
MRKRDKIKKWIIATFIFTIGICYMFSFFPKHFAFNSFIFAFELNFLMMGWFAFSTPKLKLSYKWNYFIPKKIENNGEIYNYFGVNLFRKTLVLIGWERITNSMNMSVKNNYDNLKSREINTRAGEFSHLVIAIIILIITPFLVNSLEEAKWLIITNIVFNIYPVFTQRYNRPRYLRVLRIFEKRMNLNLT